MDSQILNCIKEQTRIETINEVSKSLKLKIALEQKDCEHCQLLIKMGVIDKGGIHFCGRELIRG